MTDAERIAELEQRVTFLETSLVRHITNMDRLIDAVKTITEILNQRK